MHNASAVAVPCGCSLCYRYSSPYCRNQLNSIYSTCTRYNLHRLFNGWWLLHRNPCTSPYLKMCNKIKCILQYNKTHLLTLSYCGIYFILFHIKPDLQWNKINAAIKWKSTKSLAKQNRQKAKSLGYILVKTARSVNTAFVFILLHIKSQHKRNRKSYSARRNSSVAHKT